MADEVDIAQALFGTKRKESQSNSPTDTSTTTGIAMSDSADGIVLVNLGGTTVAEDSDTDETQYAEIATTADVREGDTVQVTLVGATAKTPTVTGVVGGGDRTQTEVDSAQSSADAAQTTADTAKSDAATAQASADANETALNAFKSDASNTYATKTELSSTESGINASVASTYATKTSVQQVSTAATNAQSTADSAKTQADAAKSTADSAASTAATASTTATNASNDASAAVTTADNAKTTAESASSTATTAKATADTAKSTADTAKSTADSASSTASTAKTTADNALTQANQTASDLSTFSNSTTANLSDLQSQIDGAVTTYFLAGAPSDTTEPTSEWTTTAIKQKHVGDLYYDTQTGYDYRYGVADGVYSWSRIVDADVSKALSDAAKAQDTADGKRRVFVATPTPPYDVGDLWTQGSGGDLMRCSTAKATGASYAAADWTLASKYTDDTTANAAVSTANSASSTANSAASTANTAKSTAEGAASTASTASANASAAVSTANTAKSTADSAATDAASAVSTANTANSTANTANSNAQAAVTTANEAKDDVTALQTTVTENYATKSELSATDSELQGKVTDSYSRATAYADGKVATEVTDRNAAITAKATEINSTVASTYTTKTDFDALQVGGTNLWKNSSFASTNAGTNYQWGKAPSGYIPVHEGDTFVLSLNIDGYVYTSTSKGYAYAYAYDSNKTRVGTTEVARSHPKLPNTCGQIYTVPSGVAYIQAYVGIGPATVGSIFRGKLERGNKATDWSPAPEDMLSTADAATTYATQSSLTQQSDRITAEVSARATTDGNVTALGTRVTQTESDISSEVSARQTTDGNVTALTSRVTQTESNVTTLFTDTETAQTTADTAVTNAATAKSAADAAQATADTANGTANTLATLIRDSAAGTLVTKVGQSIGALVNANGSYDIVALTWSGTTPTIGATLFSAKENEIDIGANSQSSVIKMCNDAGEITTTTGRTSTDIALKLASTSLVLDGDEYIAVRTEDPNGAKQNVLWAYQDDDMLRATFGAPNGRTNIVGNEVQVNGQDVYAWVQVATWTNANTATFADLSASGYHEFMVAAYRSSVPECLMVSAPVALLASSQRQFYMTGGYNESTHGRLGIALLSLTSAVKLTFKADGSEITSGITWYLFAR